VRAGVRLRVIGQSIDGRNMDLLQVGEDVPGQPRKLRVWIIARQHPGTHLQPGAGLDACLCTCV